MSSISVKWQNADSAVLMYGSQRTELSGVIASVRGIKSYRCMRGGNFSSVYSALDRVITRLEKEKNDIKTLETTMSEILKLYKTCETNVEGQIKGSDLEEVNSSGGLGELALGILGEAGPIGAALAAMGKPMTADWGDWVSNAGNIVDLLDSVNDVVDGAAGFVGKHGMPVWAELIQPEKWKELVQPGKLKELVQSEKFKDLVGLNDGFEDLIHIAPNSNIVPSEAFKEIFKNSWKDAFDFKLPEGATTADKVQLGAKWAGAALTFAGNAFDNIGEYKEGGISVGRAIGETVVETATDIALDAAIGAGVAAVIGGGLAAAGAAVAAPAVVIGAASVGVAWAANKGCEWVTETFFGEKKDIGEVVADAVFDTVEWGADLLGKGCKAATDTFTKWGKALFG